MCSARRVMAALGDGQGLIVKRGFRQPPSYHTDKLKHAPVGHFFDVVTNGFGAMPSYASRVPVDDRWRIISYIRALQYSQSATVNDVPARQTAPISTKPAGAAAAGCRARRSTWGDGRASICSRSGAQRYRYGESCRER